MVTGSSDHNIITPLHLSNSIQSAFEAIQRSQQDTPLNEHYGGGGFPYNNSAVSNRHQRRRSSLPADPSLFKSLKRTPSHKRFPHLNPTKSIPFGFSPATAELEHHSLLPSLRPSKSHCNFPHLPCAPVRRSSRRGSLPANFKLKDQSLYEHVVTQSQRQRRGSFPLIDEMIQQRELPRCKAKRKANITLTHLLNEWKKKSEQLKSETKRVKSEPHIRHTYSKSSVLSTAKKTEKYMVRSSSLFTNFDVVGHTTNDFNNPPYNASSSTGAIKQRYALNESSSRHYAPSSSYLVHVHYTDSQAVRSLSKPSSIHHHQHHNHQSRRTSSILENAK